MASVFGPEAMASAASPTDTVLMSTPAADPRAMPMTRSGRSTSTATSAPIINALPLARDQRVAWKTT